MITRCARILVYSSVLFALFACKKGGDPASCDLREESSTCMDLKARGTIEQTCANMHGKFSKAACPRDGVVGGCQSSEDLTTWYYWPTSAKGVTGAPISLDEVKSKCTSGKAVDPNGKPL